MPEVIGGNLIPPHTLLGGPEKMNMLFDEQMHNQREGFNNARAWENLKLRKATNAETIDHIVDANFEFISHITSLGASLQGQVGVTQGQQTVSPEGLATGEAIKAVPGVAAGGEAIAGQQVATNVAQLASALVPIMLATSGVVSAEALASLLPVVIRAVGESSKTAGSTPAA